MKRNHLINGLAALSLSITLAGCGGENIKKTFGLEANPPDAFDVGTQAPLSLPPELGTNLPKPNPGEPRPQEVDAGQAGLTTLSPASALAPTPGSTPGQQALLQAAGPTPPAGIRADVNQSALIASKPPGFVSSLMGSGPAPAPTVDAAAEARRLQDNAATGQPVTAGPTPQQTNEKPGLLHSLLNIF
ncbi:MAG: hypothetical protein B7Z75_01975 [Acidocella sp. 20-57-95]|nr:MAG: hypothetical protein B7Z75_01975 [Acidocella sp. 20-57-95]OYV59002.1 MAG: hypothetical protein B7Z71_08970 [Acidocella sp. 21-58-7]HQT63770.1 DUF3035 domain-containing protein [Acidocella sp.]HQU05479.1 DUF3035 domain-containing protein [Acidocella sp.]